MPRKPRGKITDGVYHVICRSIKEVRMFKADKDKTKYLELIKEYKDMYGFELYEYCIMGNHMHLMMDPNGANLSKIMHGINSSYVKYFNKKYDRYGHLFQERFKSIPIKDEQNAKNVSLYIHNNPRDIKKYKENPEDYKFSSLGIYFGTKKDKLGLINTDYVLKLFGSDPKYALEAYYRILKKISEVDYSKISFEHLDTHYKDCKTYRLESIDPEKVIEKIFECYGINKILIHIRYGRMITDAKALSVLALRRLCGLSCEAIAHLIGDITQSRISQLCSMGSKLLRIDNEAQAVFEEVLKLGTEI